MNKQTIKRYENSIWEVLCRIDVPDNKRIIFDRLMKRLKKLEEKELKGE